MDPVGLHPSIGEHGRGGSHCRYSPNNRRELAVTTPFTHPDRTDCADQCVTNDHQRGGGDCPPTTGDWLGLRGEGDMDCDENMTSDCGDLQRPLKRPEYCLK